MNTHFYKLLMTLSVIIGLGGCATAELTSTTSLYDRLGGKTAIHAVISDFVDMVGGDTRIQHEEMGAELAAIDIHQLKDHLVNQVCMEAGGPCTYTGRDIKRLIKGLGSPKPNSIG